MLSISDLQVPIVDGIPSELPMEGFITLFPTDEGLKAMDSDGNVALANEVGGGNSYGVMVGVGRGTDLLLMQVIQELRKMNTHLSIVNEVEI